MLGENVVVDFDAKSGVAVLRGNRPFRRGDTVTSLESVRITPKDAERKRQRGYDVFIRETDSGFFDGLVPYPPNVGQGGAAYARQSDEPNTNWVGTDLVATRKIDYDEEITTSEAASYDATSELEPFLEYVTRHNISGNRSALFEVQRTDSKEWAEMCCDTSVFDPAKPRVPTCKMCFFCGPSSVHKSKDGLFCTRDIACGQVICEFTSDPSDLSSKIAQPLPHTMLKEAMYNARIVPFLYRHHTTGEQNQTYLVVAAQDIPQAHEISLDAGLYDAVFEATKRPTPQTHWWSNEALTNDTTKLLKYVLDPWYALVCKDTFDDVARCIKDAFDAKTVRSVYEDSNDVYSKSRESLREHVEDRTYTQCINLNSSLFHEKAMSDGMIAAKSVPDLAYLVEREPRLGNIQLYQDAAGAHKVIGYQWNTTSCDYKGKCIDVQWERKGPSPRKNRLTAVEADYYTKGDIACQVYNYTPIETLDASWAAYVNKYIDEARTAPWRYRRASLIPSVQYILDANESAESVLPYLNQTVLDRTYKNKVDVTDVLQVRPDGRIRFVCSKNAPKSTMNAAEAAFYTGQSAANVMAKKIRSSPLHETWQTYLSKQLDEVNQDQ